jgi:hypothetical protein
MLFCSLCWPEPDYPEASTFYETSIRAETNTVVQRFSALFAKDRTDIMHCLNELPEFAGLDELQMKTIFSVIVVGWII